tara:strand:+ start:548 stop:1759 length:1212 start_codon:yes stop_codon:yes gene_type:complete
MILKPNRGKNLFHRAIFLFSVLGLLTTVHLYIMNERGFDKGCFGIETNQQLEESFDCESVVQDGLVIFGISNITLGFLYYSILILCTVGAGFNVKNNSLKLIKLRNGFIIFGFIYSIYLAIHQHFILEEYCALCLVSGVISLCLFILLLLSGFPKNISIPDKSLYKHFYILLAIGAVLACWDFYYFSTLEKSNKNESLIEESAENNSAPKNDLEFIPEDCSFDDRKKSISDFKHLITDYDIKYGNENSDNILIEIFDPNCTHCKKLHPKMKKIIEEFEDDVFIVIKPNPLWSHSIIQIQALYIAHESGLFNEMLERQFELHTPGKGINLNQILVISEEIGLDREMVETRIKIGHYVNQIMAENKKIKATGIKSAPTLLFNGYPIAGKSRNSDCIGEFIRRELD